MATLTATGNLGKDAELKNASNGSAFLKFSVGDSKSRKLPDGTWEELAQQWLECTIWGPQAEAFADLRKGDRVEIVGEFYVRTYEKDGVERQSLDVKVHGVKVLKRKDGSNGYGGQAQQPAGVPQGAQGGGNQQAPAQWGNQPQNGQQWGQPAPF